MHDEHLSLSPSVSNQSLQAQPTSTTSYTPTLREPTNLGHSATSLGRGELVAHRDMVAAEVQIVADTTISAQSPAVTQEPNQNFQRLTASDKELLCSAIDEIFAETIPNNGRISHLSPNDQQLVGAAVDELLSGAPTTNSRMQHLPSTDQQLVHQAIDELLAQVPKKAAHVEVHESEEYTLTLNRPVVHETIVEPEITLQLPPSQHKAESKFVDKFEKNDNAINRVAAWMKFKKFEVISTKIKDCREALETVKNESRDLIDNSHALVKELHENAGRMKLSSGGMGGAYFVKNAKNENILVVKPNGQNPFEIDNAKGLSSIASPTSEEARIRSGIPPFTTTHTDVLVSKIAQEIGLGHVTPESELAIVHSDSFHLITDNLIELKGDGNDAEAFRKALGPQSHEYKEKLVSVQRFIPGIEDVSVLYDSSQNHEAIDHQDFEDCFLLSCISGETDGNLGNYSTQAVETDADGKVTKYRLYKLDNSLSFAEDNTDFLTSLRLFEGHMNEPLSEKGKQLLLDLPLESIKAKMGTYKRSDAAIEAFEVRIRALQQEIKTNSKVCLMDLHTVMMKFTEEKEIEEEIAEEPLIQPSPQANGGTEAQAADFGTTIQSGRPSADLDVNVDTPYDFGKATPTAEDFGTTVRSGRPSADLNVNVDTPDDFGKATPTAEDFGTTVRSGRPSADLDVNVDTPDDFGKKL